MIQIHLHFCLQFLFTVKLGWCTYTCVKTITQADQSDGVLLINAVKGLISIKTDHHKLNSLDTLNPCASLWRNLTMYKNQRKSRHGHHSTNWITSLRTLISKNFENLFILTDIMKFLACAVILAVLVAVSGKSLLKSVNVVGN